MARIGVLVGIAVGISVAVGVGVTEGVQVGTRVLIAVAIGEPVAVGVNVGKGVRVAGAWANTTGKRPDDWVAKSQTSPPKTTMFTKVKRESSTVHCWSVIVAISRLNLFIIRLVP